MVLAVQLIKQSQDDGAAEVVTWKISPVNHRLGTAKSKQFLGMTPHPYSSEVHHLQFFCASMGQYALAQSALRMPVFSILLHVLEFLICASCV